MLRRHTMVILGGGFLLPARAWAAPLPLWLAQLYRPGLPLADYWVSEKYDGVRGYWDGTALISRGGERIPAPAWFTQGWLMSATAACNAGRRWSKGPECAGRSNTM